MTTDLTRLSINRATTRDWPLPDLVSACADRGITGIGLWREDVDKHGADEAARIVGEAGLRVTSLCRGGFFTSTDSAERRVRRDDNRRAVEEAAAVGTDVLVLVSGGVPGTDRGAEHARARVADAIAELVPHAEQYGVRLAIEALHPMFCSDRCVVNTLDQALDLADQHPTDAVGVVVDAYHVWWDPGLAAAIERAAGRILSFQVADWITPLPEGVLTGRGLMGDGCIPLPSLLRAVDRAGYDGPIEVEIFNERLWRTPGNEVLDLILDRYPTAVLERSGEAGELR